MAANISQKEYLKKYLSGGKSSDVKKKKKKRSKGVGLQIIDDDIDVSKLQPLDSAEIDILLDGNEDAPQIAGIVDDRPEEVKKMEQFRLNSKWRVLTEDDGFNSKVKIEEVKGKRIRAEGQNDSDTSPLRNTSRVTDDGLGSVNKQEHGKTKLYSDESPRRKQRSSDLKKSIKNRSHSHSSNDRSPPSLKSEKKLLKPTEKSDSDISPSRRSSHRKSEKQDSDISPPRRSSPRKSEKQDSDISPPRRSSHRKSEKQDSDISPPRRSSHRKSEKQDSDISPPRRSSHRKSEKQDSDISPPRRSSHRKSEKQNSDVSPLQKSRKKIEKSDSDQSPVRKRRPGNESDSDVSPPRKTTKRTERKSRWGYFEDPDKEKSGDLKVSTNYEKQQRNHSPDASPPRRKRNDHSDDRNVYQNRKRDVSEDLSPPRKRNHDSTDRHRDTERNRRDQGPSQWTSSRQEQTFEGRKAGFRDAKQFSQEDAESKRREQEVLQDMGDEASGRNAQTVARKTGRKRQPSIDKEQQERDAAKQREREEKYSRWGRGVKQTEEREGRVQDYLHEVNKPLARYRDDQDLEVMLKEQDREGDPMANYMREKRGETGAVEAKPIYKGSYPPNRFQIRPGYRWDGVDRSSGYEKKYFENKNSKIALEKDAYKWSTEDM